MPQRQSGSIPVTASATSRSDPEPIPAASHTSSAEAVTLSVIVGNGIFEPVLDVTFAGSLTMNEVIEELGGGPGYALVEQRQQGPWIIEDCRIVHGTDEARRAVNSFAWGAGSGTEQGSQQVWVKVELDGLQESAVTVSSEDMGELVDMVDWASEVVITVDVSFLDLV